MANKTDKTAKSTKTAKTAKTTKTAKTAKTVKAVKSPKQKLAKAELNRIMSKLPNTVIDHSNRVKLWASFLIERIKSTDDFINLKLKPKLIIDAVYYHDLGKSEIPNKYINAEACKTVEAKKVYQTHVIVGLGLIEKKFGVTADKVKQNSFEQYVLGAISEHHERLDGKGFPNSLKESALSVVGKITAIADTFDSLLYEKKGRLFDFDGVVATMKERSGVTLDKALTDAFLEDSAQLSRFVEYVGPKGKLGGKGKNAEYGVKISYRPVYDIRENRLHSYVTEICTKDPYLGLMKASSYMDVARQSRKLSKLEELAFERLCLEIDRLFDGENELPPFIFPVSAQHFKKKGFLPYLKKIAKKYEIPDNQIYFAISDSDMSEIDLEWNTLINEYRSEGFKFVIKDFGDTSTLFGKYPDIAIECICMKDSYTKRLIENPKTYSVVSGMVKIAYSLHIKVMFGDVEKRSTEGELLRIGGRYAYGDLYGNEQILNDVNALASEGGALQ